MNPEKRRAIQSEIYKTESKTIEHYKPEVLGMGWEQIVIEVPGRDKIVVKAHKQVIEQVLGFNEQAGFQPDYLDPRVEESLKHVLDAVRETRDELEEYFQQHTLRQKDYLGKVPVTRTLLASIFGPGHSFVQSFPDETRDITTLIRIQEKLPTEAVGKNAVSFEYPYAEIDGGISSRDYTELSTHLLSSAEAEFNLDVFKQTLSADVLSLLDQSDSDPALRKVLEDFVTKAIQYSNDTGRTLDLAGENNAVFFKDESDEWNYLLPDALSPDFGQEGAITALRNADFKHVDDTVLSISRNALNYIRTINGLAEVLNLDKKIYLFLPETLPDFESLQSAIGDEYARSLPQAA